MNDVKNKEYIKFHIDRLVIKSYLYPSELKQDINDDNRLPTSSATCWNHNKNVQQLLSGNVGGAGTRVDKWREGGLKRRLIKPPTTSVSVSGGGDT